MLELKKLDGYMQVLEDTDMQKIKSVCLLVELTPLLKFMPVLLGSFWLCLEPKAL